MISAPIKFGFWAENGTRHHRQEKSCRRQVLFFLFFSFDCDMFHHWQFAYENTLCCFWAVVREDTVVPCSSVQRFLIVTSTRTAIFGMVHITVTYSLTLANFANGNSNSFAFTSPISVSGTVRARQLDMCPCVNLSAILVRLTYRIPYWPYFIHLRRSFVCGQSGTVRG